jgi:lipoprotein-anchoring transpeptidase ErfK/SrfK
MRWIPLLLVSCANLPTHAPVATHAAAPPPPIAAPIATSIAAPAAAAPPSARVAEVEDDGEPTVEEVVHATALRKAPSRDAALVGVIDQGTRAAVLTIGPTGDGCGASRWIELAPRGWICESALAPTTELPTPATEVALDHLDDELVPGSYGAVRHGAVAFASRAELAAGEPGHELVGTHSVRQLAVVAIGGARYWLTSAHELIAASSIIPLAPSSFKGVVIADGAPLPAWTRGSAREPIKTYDEAGAITGTLAPRTVVTVVETSADGRRVRVDAATWLARADVRVATAAAPPPGTADDEKWFDVDRDEQVLVAYEGARPVYATLVSTGRWDHATPTSVARIASKHLRATMTDAKGGSYAVADVPWTMYYDRDFALHTSYWHDGFGAPRSHGCVNLAPRDARVLYQWSSPDVPPGWTTVYADADRPGSMVRVRSHADPEPAFRGYARTMREVATR